ncbi:hypothetical protein C0Q70_16933 [Pomacea canaliculata]|uniref:Uncharacterized protein n=1 Tax=Pomacea canaliculata TaxID=400727 RepID=A0A2T7NR61_POMCA|nr:hypothetical protein C0Q70_16933 [Pomacea canaliculata]
MRHATPRFLSYLHREPATRPVAIRMKSGDELFPVKDTDSCLLYLKLAERYQQLSSLRENLIAAASEIKVKELRRSVQFSALPVELQKDILLRRLERLDK